MIAESPCRRNSTYSAAICRQSVADAVGARVQSTDGGLNLIRADLAHVEGLLDQCQTFLNRTPIPQRAILLGEQDQLAMRSNPRRAPRVVQQHQAQKT